METIKSIIPNTFDYHVTKVYEGIFNNYPLTKINFESVKKTCDDLKAEIDKRYGLSHTSGAKDTLDSIDYVLKKVGDWIDSNAITGNQDAMVFMDAFRYHYFKELEEMIEEMDSGKV